MTSFYYTNYFKFINFSAKLIVTKTNYEKNLGKVNKDYNFHKNNERSAK